MCRGCQLEHLAKGRDRALHVLLGLRQPQREVAIGIPRRLGDEHARTCHGFGPLAGLDERQNQVVRRLPERGTLGERVPERVDGGVERANAFERLPKPVLDVGVARGEPRGFPEEREGRGVVALGFERDRAIVGLPRARRLLCAGR